MSQLSLRPDQAPRPPSTRPMGEGVSRAEVERRLFFVAEKMLDGVSRRMLVELSMDLFGIGQRMAQKYVAKVERRLRNQAVRQSPLFYLELSKMQRDKLLESVLRHVNQPEDLEPKLLAELVMAANRVLDSRDRAAVLLFQSRAAEENPPARIEMKVKTLETETKLLRGGDEDEPVDAGPAGCGAVRG